MWPFKTRFLNSDKLYRVAQAIYEADPTPEWDWIRLKEGYNLGHPFAEKRLSTCICQAEAAIKEL